MERFRAWMQSWLTYKHLALGAVVLVVISFYLGGRLQNHQAVPFVVRSDDASMNGGKAAPTVEKNDVDEKKTASEVVVHVAGAVKKPGVYTLPMGSRLEKAVQQAEPLADAALDALNLAARLNDGEKVVVPQQGEVNAEAALAATVSPAADAKISLNRADKNQLETLPGIGPSKADAIIAYRQEKAGFKDIHELKEVPGIGEKTFAQLADQIVL